MVGAATDSIVGVTYGGVAMSRIRTEVDSVDEPMRSYLYFLGARSRPDRKRSPIDLSGEREPGMGVRMFHVHRGH